MLNEQPGASMAIKQTTKNDANEFENPYVGEQKLERPKDMPMPEPVILYRSKEGIQRWLDKEKVGVLLAQTKSMVYDDNFKEQYKEEIDKYYERQPEGKEIKTVFDILEVGDSVNHQTVVEVDSKGVTLDYFGHKSHIEKEMEIFSVLIKEEIEEWKKQIKKLDPNTLFAKEDDNLVTLYRAMELLCMNVNMEECDGLFPASDDKVTSMLTAVMAMSLRKPVFSNETGKNVIAVSADYVDRNSLKLEGSKILYHVSLYNREGIEVEESDRVVLC